MFTCFLDTNIITDWIIINEKLQEIDDSDKKTSTDKRIEFLKNLGKIRSEALYSYLLMEAINTNDSIPDFNFVTSDLAIAETISVTHERYIAEELFRLLLPLKYLPIIKRKYENENVSKVHAENISRFIKNFLGIQKIKIVENVNLKMLFYTITKCKIDTYDSFLICQAIQNSCKFFISNDEHAKRRGVPKIKIVKSAYIYNLIQDKIKKPVIDFKLLS